MTQNGPNMTPNGPRMTQNGPKIIRNLSAIFFYWKDDSANVFAFRMYGWKIITIDKKQNQNWFLNRHFLAHHHQLWVKKVVRLDWLPLVQSSLSYQQQQTQYSKVKTMRVVETLCIRHIFQIVPISREPRLSLYSEQDLTFSQFDWVVILFLAVVTKEDICVLLFSIQ